MTSTDGRLLAGRYVLGPVIGRGGLADVHRATDRTLDREVAVKVLRDLHADAADRTRFENEGRLLSRLSHPGLLSVLDVGADGGRPFLVLELVHGGTLREACAAGPLPPARVASIGAEVADALAHVHARGVVHRDVKPSNILLQPDGRARLADFGIARLAGEISHVTRSGATVGSPAYLSPEQVRGERGLTAATDVYSFGLVLLEALTARRAFDGSAVEAAVARLTRSPRLPTTLSPSWVALLAALTDADPAARPSADEAAGRLRRLAAHESRGSTAALPAVDADDTQGWSPFDAPEVVLPLSPAPSVGKTERRRRRLLAPALVLVAAAVALVVALSFRDAAPAVDPPSSPVAEQTTPAAPSPSTTAPAAPVPAAATQTPSPVAPSSSPTPEPVATTPSADPAPGNGNAGNGNGNGNPGSGNAGNGNAGNGGAGNGNGRGNGKGP